MTRDTGYRVTCKSDDGRTFVRWFGSRHHAEQYARALRLHLPLAGSVVTVADAGEPARRADSWGAAVLAVGAL